MSYSVWIDRYLGEVARGLRGDGRDDIVAELRSTLEDEVQGIAAQEDRNPTEADARQVLQRFGSPSAVAHQYSPPRSLIGPTLFPEYLSTLGYLLALTLAIRFVTLLLGSEGNSVYGAAEDLLTVGFWTLAITTGVYAAIEAAGDYEPATQDWRPEQLPEPEAIRLQARPGHLVSNLITDGFFLLWWTGAISLVGWFGLFGSDVRVTPSSAWTPFNWPLLTLIGCSFALHACVLLQGHWRRWSLVVSLSISVALAAIGLLLLNAGDLAVVTGAAWAETDPHILRALWCSVLVVVGFVVWEAVWAARVLFFRASAAD
ncbi:MAG: hypothetical protein AAF515_09775 [Pseudomonadota bacterium]